MWKGACLAMSEEGVRGRYKEVGHQKKEREGGKINPIERRVRGVSRER